MKTAVDTSVLLDILADDPVWADRSSTALRLAARKGALLIGECVLAELTPALAKEQEVRDFLSDLGISFVPISMRGALLAGAMYARYLTRRKAAASRVIPDFLIGAHAITEANALLARDRGYYRDYFHGLRLLQP